MHKIMEIIKKNTHEREEKLLEEIKDLKEYNAKFSEDRFMRMETQIKKLKEEYEKERQTRLELEQHYKQERRETMSLYTEAEVMNI